MPLVEGVVEDTVSSGLGVRWDGSGNGLNWSFYLGYADRQAAVTAYNAVLRGKSERAAERQREKVAHAARIQAAREFRDALATLGIDIISECDMEHCEAAGDADAMDLWEHCGGDTRKTRTTFAGFVRDGEIVSLPTEFSAEYPQFALPGKLARDVLAFSESGELSR